MATYDTFSLLKHLQPVTIERLFASIRGLIEQPSEEYPRIEFSTLLVNLEELARRWHVCLSTDHPQKEALLITKTHDVLQMIQTIHDSSCDCVQLARQLLKNYDGDFTLDESFTKWNRYEQASFIFLTDQKFWSRWSNLVVINDCNRKRKCIKYPNLPLKKPTQKRLDIKRIEETIVDFFRSFKSCRSCSIQTYRLGPNYHYFATLQEKPVVLEIDNPEKDSFVPTRVVLPFRFIFSYNEEEGTFSLYGVDDIFDCNRLASVLVRELIGYVGELTREPKPVYNLSPLKDRSFLFNIDASDGVEEIIFKNVTIRLIDDPNTLISFSNAENGVFHCIDQYLSANKRKIENIEIVQATILFRMRPEFSTFRHVTLELSLTGDNLSEKTEAQARMLKKYIRRWKLLLLGDQLDTTLIGELIKFSFSEKPIMNYQYRESLPSVVRFGLLEWGFLKPARSASSVQIGDTSFNVEFLRRASGDDIVPVVISQNGSINEIEDEDVERYWVDYSPMAELLHNELECKGQVRMELDNKVWWLGTRGQEGRNIYFVRNWAGFQDVGDFLKGVKDSSLVIYMSNRPDHVRIGNKSSDIAQVASDLQNQYYDINGLVEYSDSQGFLVSAEPIWENIKTMYAKRPVKRRVRTPGKRDQNRELVESIVWRTGIGLVDQLKRYMDGDDLSPVEFEGLTKIYGHRKKDILSKWFTPLKDYELSRVFADWNDKEKCPFGVIYMELFNILFPPPKDQYDILEAREERVSYLYNFYPELLRKLRKAR